MRKIVAALAALLVLVFGLVTSTVAAQDRNRSAAGASVRASIVIRHVVQEGENLTTDDGLYGEGGIMQHYFGRHRSGDIARLRGYDGNFRAIRVARCDWPEEVPVEERTTLQECPNAYATYTIRRAVGRTIEVPMRWVPVQRLAELLRVTPGVARDMRRIAQAVDTPEAAPVDEDPGMANEDPLGDAPTVALAGTGDALDAGADMVFTETEPNEPDAGVALAGGTGIIPDPPHGGTGGTGGSEGGSHEGSGHGGGEPGGGSDGNVVTASLLSPTGGGIGWSLVLLLGLVQGGTALRRRKAKGAVDKQKSNPSPLAPDDDIVQVRKSRDGYRDANIAMMGENSGLQNTIRENAEAASTKFNAADDARKEVERVLKQVGATLSVPDVQAEPAQTFEKRSRDGLLEWAKSVAVVIQKVALATGVKSTDHGGLVKELQKAVTGLLQAPPPHAPQAAKRVEEDAAKREERERRVTRLQTRVEELERELLDYEIGKKQTPKEVWYEKQRIPALETQVAELEETLRLARDEVASLSAASVENINVLSAERQQTVGKLESELGTARANLDDALATVGLRDEQITELKQLVGDLEAANEDLARSIATGGREAPDADELPGTATAITTLQNSGTSPGVGLGEVEGAPQGAQTEAPAASGTRNTMGYQDIKPRGDETVNVSLPRPPRAPTIRLDTDGDNDPSAPGSGNGASHVSHKQPVMCGCKKEFRWDEWAEHAATCPDADKVQVPASEAQSKPKKRRERRSPS